VRYDKATSSLGAGGPALLPNGTFVSYNEAATVGVYANIIYKL
jgi:hypothetical protein